MPSEEQHNLMRAIERLVDGQLDEASRRQLLERLDREPEGWRRCALAFLEDQCWREALAPSLDSKPDEPLASVDRHTDAVSAGAQTSDAALPGGRRWWRQPRQLVASAANHLALAAGLLIAFGLGWSLARPGALFQRGPLPVAHRLERPEATSSQGVRPAESAPSIAPAAVAQASSATAAHAARSTPRGVTPSQRPASDAARSTTVAANTNSAAQRLVTEPTDDEPSPTPSMWVVDPSSDLAAQLFEAIHRSGHRIERSREWWPADVTGGQLGIVPVERVKIRLIDDSIQ